MFIEVNKIVKDKKRDNSGNEVQNPNPERVVREKTKVVSEMIALSEIKSARPWHKSRMDEAEHPNLDMTIVYMKGDGDAKESVSENRKSKVKPAEIMIAEKYQDFMGRVGATRLKDAT